MSCLVVLGWSAKESDIRLVSFLVRQKLSTTIWPTVETPESCGGVQQHDDLQHLQTMNLCDLWLQRADSFKLMNRMEVYAADHVFDLQEVLGFRWICWAPKLQSSQRSSSHASQTFGPARVRQTMMRESRNYFLLGPCFVFDIGGQRVLALNQQYRELQHLKLLQERKPAGHCIGWSWIPAVALLHLFPLKRSILLKMHIASSELHGSNRSSLSEEAWNHDQRGSCWKDDC